MMKYAIVLGAVVVSSPLVAGQAAAWAQCGGIGWTGATTCVSGSVCTKINDYYSQCIPGSQTTGPTSTTTTTTTPTSGPTATSSTLPWVGGVNMAGYDFSVATDGSFKNNVVDPPASQFTHFASQGVNIFRIPFAWQLMTPTVGGTIDSTFFARYDNTVQTARRTGAYVIIDLHNYARWNGAIIAQGGPTNDQYASIWSQLATKYKSDSKIIFGIMNEPHDVNVNTWITSVQAAVNAIRAAGATSNYILIPGSSWSSAAALPSEAGPGLLSITDPAGNGSKSKLIFDVHKYLDSDNSGTHADCTTNNVDTFTTLYNWLQTNNRQALLSETGGGNTASCETMVAQELAYIKSHPDRFVGFTMWSAGGFDTTYVLTLTPNGNQDQPLWTIAVKPYLP